MRALIERREMALEYLLDQRVLRTEVVIDGGHVDLGARGDHAQ